MGYTVSPYRKSVTSKARWDTQCLCTEGLCTHSVSESEIVQRDYVPAIPAGDGWNVSLSLTGVCDLMSWNNITCPGSWEGVVWARLSSRVPWVLRSDRMG